MNDLDLYYLFKQLPPREQAWIVIKATAKALAIFLFFLVAAWVILGGYG